MTKEEKLQQIAALQDLFKTNDEEELKSLLNECIFAKTPFPHDILYADGTVSRALDLTKEPVAVKFFYIIPKEYFQGNSLFPEEYSFWLRLQTSYPQSMTKSEACRYVDELPAVNGKKWRLPTGYELSCIFNRFMFVDERFEKLERLRRFFELPPFFLLEEKDSDGRLVPVGTSEGTGYHPLFIRGSLPLEEDELCYWWPVCDV